MVEVLNAELCNVLGNLMNRVSSKSVNKNQIFPQYDEFVFKRIATVKDMELLTGMKNIRGNLKLI